ncbi:MAG: hypothetical protein JNM10_13335 [Planctomycetia bacterium]|nr:hypothetical protein [Planctomycetia bacterium]
MDPLPPLAAAPGSPGGPVRRVLPPWMPLLVVAAAWAAQGGVLRNGFVWDDGILLRPSSPIARGFAAIPELFLGTWGGAVGSELGLYRPVVSATLAVQAGLHGVENPFPFHLVNLLLHGVASVLVLAVAHRLLPRRPVVSATTALLFAMHPLHTGTVSWIVARGDLLATVFAALAFLVWTARPALSPDRALGAALLYLLACLSKEAALPLPGVLLLVDAAASRGLRPALRARWGGYAALAGALVAWGVLRATAGDPAAVAANGPFVARTLFERMLVAAVVLVRMAAKVFVPAGLTGDASNDPVLWSATDLPMTYAVAGAGVAVALLAVVVRAARGRAGLASACVAAFVLLALPVLQLVPIGAAFEDRYAYLPSVALLPLAGLGAERLLAVGPRTVVLGALTAVLLALVPASWAVAATWRDDAAFDAALLEADPAHLRALDRTARRLLLDGLAAKEAADRTPATQAARVAALHARRASSVERAVRMLERARAHPRGDADASLLETLGDAYLLLPVRRDADAKAAYERHLALRYVPGGKRREADVVDPRPVPAADRRDLARVFRQLHIAWTALEPDDLAGQAAYLERATFWTPRDLTLARIAAGAWNVAQQPARALPHLERAVALAATDRSVTDDERASLQRTLDETRARAAEGPDAAFARALEALRRAGGHVEALGELRDAVAQRPTFVDAWLELAKVYKYKGNYRDAFDALAEAKRALDATKAAATDPRRAQVAALEARYRDEQAAADRDEGSR